MTAVNKLNYSVLESRIKTVADEYSINDSLAFTYFIVEMLFPEITLEMDEIITDGSGDEGIDAIYIQEGGECSAIHIIQCKHTPVFKNISKNVNENSIHKLKTFIDRVCDQDLTLETTANKKIFDKVQDIWELTSKGVICQFHFYVCSNQKGLNADTTMKAKSLLASNDQSTFSELNFSDLCDYILNESEATQSCELKIIDKQIYERVDGNIKGIIANIDVVSYVEAITNKSGSIKRYLFDDNIRTYLGKGAGYNPEIIASALDERNHLFWYLNNGITLVCNKASYQKNMSGVPLKLENFKVVNGAQTSFSLVDAYNTDPELVGQIVLLLKVYETEEPEVAQKVTIATNSQASIYPRDLRANDKVQIFIQKSLKTRGLNYIRKRGELDGKRVGRVLDSLRLGQMIMAYKLVRPHQCKTESDNIFGKYYDELFNGDLDPDYIIELNECYLTLMDLRKVYLQEGKRFTGNKLPQRYYVLNYGYWYVLTALALICRREKITFPSKEHILEYIDLAVTEVSGILANVSDTSQYNNFRSQKVTALLFNDVFLKQGELFESTVPE